MKNIKQFIAVVGILGLTGMLVGSPSFAVTSAVTATVTVRNVSITLSQSSFAYGTMDLNTASSSVSLFSGAGIVATNNGNVTEDFDIYGANTTGSGTNWTLDSANSTQDHYIHKFCEDTTNDCTIPAGQANYTALTTSPATLKHTIATSGTVAFQLQIKTPQTVTDYNQQSAAVTVQASATP